MLEVDFWFMSLFRKLINIVIDIIFWTCITIILWGVLRLFFFSSFKIPTDSMEPALIAGDNLLVCKPVVGARLFNIFASMRNEQVDIYRLPGVRKIKRNDILVFNFPHPQTWDKIEMHILKYYVKRCVGLPGDTLSIRNGTFYVKDVQTILGNVDSQKEIAATNIFGEGIFHSFPFDSIIGWNIKDFGPLYIPKKGDTITLDYTHFRLYKKLIEWEEQATLRYEDSTALLNNIPVDSYIFRGNYYFMAGDNGMNSQDSRYWGLLPEDFIVGKATTIWKSKDPRTGKYRWDRFFKSIR